MALKFLLNNLLKINLESSHTNDQSKFLRVFEIRNIYNMLCPSVIETSGLPASLQPSSSVISDVRKFTVLFPFGDSEFPLCPMLET